LCDKKQKIVFNTSETVVLPEVIFVIETGGLGGYPHVHAAVHHAAYSIHNEMGQAQATVKKYSASKKKRSNLEKIYKKNLSKKTLSLQSIYKKNKR
jgi:hypothetical protein